MKKKFALITLFLLITAISVSFAGEKEIIKNSGFDQTQDNLPQFWYYVGWFKPIVDFSIDTTNKHAGKASGLITITKLNEQLQSFGPPNWAQDITDNIPKGKRAKLTGYIQTKDVKGMAIIGLQCIDKNGQLVGFGSTQAASPVQGTTPWKKVSFEMDIPASTSKIRVLCMLSGTGKAWFDEVALVKVK